MDIDYKATILLVDGVADHLVLLEGVLQERYHVKLATSAHDALRIAQQPVRPDLILLDAHLPHVDGFTLFHELKANFLTVDIPVIFMVGEDAREDQRRALREGATDVIGRPVAAELLLLRVDTQLQLRQARAMLKDQHSHFEHVVAERTRAVAHMQDATVMAMATLAESRDPHVANHIRRTQHYVAALARELRFHASYTNELTDENITWLYKAAPLHDIGKAAVPDAILLKPGKLTEDEFNTMKHHTTYGRDAIADVERALGGANPFTRYASEIAYSHHEKWDGTGYPERRAGTDIPLSARLMAVADVYDALITPRSYRPAFTHETAVELIRQGSGEHFDPDVVDAMLVIEERFRDIAVGFGGLVE
ncbi:MAG: HD-GYP domain-containing protein [Gammaproteobacteria bacterium]